MNPADEFAKKIDEMIKSAADSHKSALMSEDFVERVDQLLDEIPNLRDAFRAMESHADPSNAS